MKARRIVAALVRSAIADVGDVARVIANESDGSSVSFEAAEDAELFLWLLEGVSPALRERARLELRRRGLR